MNRQYLGHHFATDVITFDYRNSSLAAIGEPTIAAEIYVCAAVAAAAARRHGTTVSRELVLYIVHGLLHLCGLDDHDDQGTAAMRRAESRLMEQLEAEVGIGGLEIIEKGRKRV